MCRGCLFVQVDLSSGGDVDGCFKQDILEDLLVEFDEGKPKAYRIIDHQMELFEACQEVACFEDLQQPAPKNYRQFDVQSHQWFKAREKTIAAFEAKMRNLARQGWENPFEVAEGPEFWDLVEQEWAEQEKRSLYYPDQDCPYCGEPDCNEDCCPRDLEELGEDEDW